MPGSELFTPNDILRRVKKLPLKEKLTNVARSGKEILHDGLKAVAAGNRGRREEAGVRREESRVRRRQYWEDYSLGGGLREGIKKGVKWGALGLVGGGYGGGLVGGVIDIVGTSLSGSSSPTPTIGTYVSSLSISPSNSLTDPRILVPVALAGFSALAAGGVGFYAGITFPARVGKSIRDGSYLYDMPR